jgi:hypothetical protein
MNQNSPSQGASPAPTSTREYPSPYNTITINWPTEGPTGCTRATCANGHRWVPTLAAVKCAGCSTPVLAIKLQCCPICNEPMEEITTLAMFVPGHEVVAKCIGG